MREVWSEEARGRLGTHRRMRTYAWPLRVPKIRPRTLMALGGSSYLCEHDSESPCGSQQGQGVT